MTLIFLRQLFVCSGVWTQYFLIGLTLGFHTVLVPQLRKNNQTISLEYFSWLPSLQMFSAIPWIIMLSVLINVIGRKKCYIIVCIFTIFTYITFYFSTNMTHFLIAQIFVGALSSSYLTIGILILTEYVSSKYRGMFLTIKTASSFWGNLVANALGTYFHWQTVVILGLVCTAYTLINVIIWPDSPLWLANKGRFAECAAAHRWLKGYGEESEKELDILLKTYENRQFVRQPRGILYVLKTLCSKQVLKPLLISILLNCLYNFAGKMICTVYALDILKKISSNESTAYIGMLILDAVTVASMYLGSLLSRFLSRRIMLLSFSSLATMFMFLIAIYLYLSKLTIIVENKYVSIFLLASYSITVSCGPIILTTSIVGELLPMELRSLSMCIMSLSFKVSLGTSLKLSPTYFKYLDMHGTFAYFGIMCTICLVILYYYLPETKDKTIQEIDVCLKGKHNDVNIYEENTELMNNVNGRR